MPKELWTIGRLLQWTEQYFLDKGASRLDGEVLLSHILGKDRIYLYTHYDEPLNKQELDAYRPLVLERAIVWLPLSAKKNSWGYRLLYRKMY